MEYVTHLREDGSYQPLKEHLEGTATRSAKFAASFGASSHAERTALLHDIGKYSPNGQRRQRDPEHTAKVDHSTAGAKAAADFGDMPAAFAIAGHHGGLPDLGTRSSLDDGTLCARLNKKLTGGDDPSAWRSEISLPTGVQLTPSWLPRNDARLTAMYIRMLFSCLVDADFLDTERALSKEEKPRGIGDSMPALLEKLQAHVAKWLEEPKSDLCALRNEVLRRCLRGSEDPQGLYSLTVPTGGGKTVSSLAFALSHAVKHGIFQPTLPVRGAWVEIATGSRQAGRFASLPVRGAWVEILLFRGRFRPFASLPVRGAWVEIPSPAWGWSTAHVAPRAGSVG